MTQEELINRGIQAAEILDNETIMSFFNEQLGDLKTVMFNTRPEASAERETLFHQHQGVVAFLDMLGAYKSAASEILTANETAELKEDD